MPAILTPRPVGRVKDVLIESVSSTKRTLSWATWWVAPLSITHESKHKAFRVALNMPTKYSVKEENDIPGRAVIIPPDEEEAMQFTWAGKIVAASWNMQWLLQSDLFKGC